MDRPALHVAIAVCVILAGCSVFGQDHTREERAVSALADARDAVNQTDSYRYEGDLRVVATADGRSERIDVRVNGTVDAAQRRMHTTAERDGEASEAYLVNRTSYRECDRMALWAVEEREADDWSLLTPAARQLSPLESGSLYFNGTETVDGEETRLLVGEPTEKALTQYQERRSQPLFGGPSIDDAEVRVWLDTESDRPRKTQVRFEVSEGGNSATATVTMWFDDYGTDAAVDVPVIPEDKQWEGKCPS